MDLNVPFMLGRVRQVEVEKDTNIITFDVPHVIENMTKYPTAYPLGNHTHRMNVGDSVFIIKVSETNRFFYQPIDFSTFTGIKQSDNNVIELKGDDELLVRVDGIDIFKIKNKKITFTNRGVGLFNSVFTCSQCQVTGVTQAVNELELL